MLGAAAVAHYAVPFSLAIRSQLLVHSLSRTLFPRLSRETVETGRRLTGHAVLSLIYLFGAICGPAILIIGPFLDLWVGHEFAQASTLVAQILIFGTWMNGLSFLPYNQLQAQGRPKVTALVHLLEVPPFLLCLWLLIQHAGLPGAALAWTLRAGADCLAMLWFARSLHGMALRALPAVGLMLLSIVVAVSLRPAPITALVLGSVLGLCFPGFRNHSRAETWGYGKGDCRTDVAPIGETYGELAQWPRSVWPRPPITASVLGRAAAQHCHTGEAAQGARCCRRSVD